MGASWKTGEEKQATAGSCAALTFGRSNKLMRGISFVYKPRSNCVLACSYISTHLPFSTPFFPPFTGALALAPSRQSQMDYLINQSIQKHIRCVCVPSVPCVHQEGTRVRGTEQSHFITVTTKTSSVYCFSIFICSVRRSHTGND